MLKRFSIAAAALGLAMILTVPLADAGRGGTQLSAELSGQNEVPGPGDPNGKGEVIMTVKRSKKKICFQVSFIKIGTPSAGHIHQGGSDEAGPIVVELFGDGPVQNNIIEDCKRVKKKLGRRIARRPDRFYVNLHNGEYPDGAIRGQLDLAL